MLTVDTNTTLVPNQEFTKLASAEQIARVARALEINGMKVLIAALRKGTLIDRTATLDTRKR